MTDQPLPAEQHMPAPDTNWLYFIAMLLIIVIGAVAVAFVPSQAAVIVTSCTSIIVALLAILKGQSSIHLAVNSKMDQLLALTRAQGKTEGKAEEKAEVAATAAATSVAAETAAAVAEEVVQKKLAEVK